MSTPELSHPGLKQLLEAKSRFLTFLRKRVPSQEVAEDLLQSAFLKTVERIDDVRDQESIVAWFYRVLRNSVTDYYREQARDRHELIGILSDLDRYAQTVADAPDEICECVRPLLTNIKPEYREALATVDLGGGSLADLASVAGITEGNAAVRIHRARKAMRKQV